MDKAFERVVKPKPAAVLRALIWPMGILMTVTLGLVFAKAPTWLLVVFSTMAVISALLYFSSYIFCLLKDRDALRSETYSLKRLGRPDRRRTIRPRAKSWSLA
jgi:hypothetical protein